MRNTCGRDKNLLKTMLTWIFCFFVQQPHMEHKHKAAYNKSLFKYKLYRILSDCIGVWTRTNQTWIACSSNRNEPTVHVYGAKQLLLSIAKQSVRHIPRKKAKMINTSRRVEILYPLKANTAEANFYLCGVGAHYPVWLETRALLNWSETNDWLPTE